MEDSDNDNAFEICRMKYAEDLEEILECPICFELPQPKQKIPMCEKGHHICLNCRDLLKKRGEKCPTCQCYFKSGRNYIAERLCEKFDDIKNSILDPKHASNRRKGISVSIQTECNNESTCSVTTQTENLSDNVAISKTNSLDMINGQKEKVVEVEKLSAFSENQN